MLREKTGRVVQVAIILFASSTTGLVHAQTDSDDVDVTAGLVSGLTVSCLEDLSFGVINLDPTGFSDGDPAVEVVVGNDGSISIRDGAASVSVRGARRGECTIAGIDETETTIDVSIDTVDGAIQTATLEGRAGALDLDAPVSPRTDLTVTAFSTDDGQTLQENGNSARPYTVVDGRVNFKFGATLTIPAPDSIEDPHLGGYGKTVQIHAEPTP
jgi:hypothetical protein